MKSEKNLRKNGNVIRWSFLAIIMAFSINAFIGQRTIIYGKSMEPCLQSGDNVIVEKVSRYLNNYNREEIILIQTSYGVFIKRIIGLPGETIRIDDTGRVLIDGKVYNDPYGDNSGEIYQGIASNVILLKDNEYFVLGDNRDESVDSRNPAVGVISKKNIIGKAVFRIYPFRKIGKI